VGVGVGVGVYVDVGVGVGVGVYVDVGVGVSVGVYVDVGVAVGVGVGGPSPAMRAMKRSYPPALASWSGFTTSRSVEAVPPAT